MAQDPGTLTGAFAPPVKHRQKCALTRSTDVGWNRFIGELDMTRCRAFILAGAVCTCTTIPQSPKSASPSPVAQRATPTASPAPVQRGIEVSDIDPKQDPCTDFFEYSNGAWRAANPIPPSMRWWSRRWAAGEANKDQLKAILDQASRREDWPAGSVEQLIGDYYASCMDEDRVNRIGLSAIAPLLDEIHRIKGRADIQRMIIKLDEIAVSVPFALVDAQDFHEPTQVIARLAARGLGLPERDYYLKTEPRFTEAREKYRTHLLQMFKLAGWSEAKARDGSARVFAMEKGLALASLDRVSVRNPKNRDHKMTVVALAQLTPHIDWKAYFDASHLPRSDLNVDQPKFMKEVDRQLERRPIADWRRYLEWHLLDSAAPWLSAPFAQESFDFKEAYLSGAKEMKPRWKRCVESTDDLLGEALGRKYVEEHFPPEAKLRAQQMVKNILLAMKETVEGLAWMGPETKKKALEKLATFNPKIGYPEKWKDYGSVKVGRGAFWQNVAAARKFGIGERRSMIGKPVDRGRWGMTPPTSNAYYNAALNEIVFPAGILQPPAFSIAATDAVNYGAIGVVIGHEISHGFDDQGSKFDAAGRLQNWWTETDLREFEGRAKCVADQFDGYFIEPGIHHNGKLVLGESIGDLAGAKIAWLAFKKSQETNPAPVIDGFTPAQQFFIAWGQFRGDAIRPETQRLMVQNDTHPIGKYRVNGPLSNLSDFQQVFRCPAGAPMVRSPENRCDIW